MEAALDLLAEQALERIAKLANVEGEVYLLDSQELTVEVADGQVENLKLAQDRGIGIRVISEGRLGYSYTSDLSSSSLGRAVEQALHNSRELEPDPYLGLSNSHTKVPMLELYDEDTFLTPLEEKIALAQSIEAAARAYDSRITITEKAAYHDAHYKVWLYNTHGLRRFYRGSYCGGYTVVVAEENGSSETGFSLDYSLRYKELDPGKIGREAARKAVRMLGAKTIDSARMPVVLDPYTAANFLGLFRTAFSGEALLKGKSFFRDQEDQMVAAKEVTIIDDGTAPGLLGSAPFDGEGTASSRTVLVEQGYFRGFLHNNYTARKMGTKSTGNGVRDSYKSVPEVGTTNLYLQGGCLSSEQILAGITKGLYLTDIMGLHMANPISGDFSLGAAGLLIENGKLTIPVKGVAIAGNLKDLLLDIDALGNDLTFYLGKGAPTVRIKAMNISGN